MQLCQQTAGVTGRLFEKTAPVSLKLEGKSAAAEVLDGKEGQQILASLPFLGYMMADG